MDHYAVPKDFTYLGIGSAPHDPPDKISAAWDQVLPVFILELLENTSKTLRIIHYDPQFKLDAMKLYFDLKNLGLSMEIEENRWTWSNSRIEIIIVPQYLYHTSWHISEIVNSVLETKGQLVVQEFTGHELSDVQKTLYDNSTKKSLFKKKILFDITYGEACHCMTDMTKYKPLYKPDGDFFNFILYTPDEMKSVINISPQIDMLIFNYFYKEYKEILDGLHLMYRRNIKKAENATDEDPDELMRLLQSKLRDLFPIFRALHALTAEKEASLELLFTNYKDHVLYKGYSLIIDHLRPSAH